MCTTSSVRSPRSDNRRQILGLEPRNSYGQREQARLISRRWQVNLPVTRPELARRPKAARQLLRQRHRPSPGITKGLPDRDQLRVPFVQLVAEPPERPLPSSERLKSRPAARSLMPLAKSTMSCYHT